MRTYISYGSLISDVQSVERIWTVHFDKALNHNKAVGDDIEKNEKGFNNLKARKIYLQGGIKDSTRG